MPQLGAADRQSLAVDQVVEAADLVALDAPDLVEAGARGGLLALHHA
jgi:hypothetical protein